MYLPLCKGLAILALSTISLATSVAHSAETVLITGANRGIGLAMARAFDAGGYTVIGTARKPASAKELQGVADKVLQLDVTDPDSVAGLARALDGEPIDFLINNAGVLAKEAAAFEDVDIEALAFEFQVNSLGPLRVTQALLPNVLTSKRKVVANISSMMGSMELNTFGCCMGYRASKAALNSFTKTLAVDMAERETVFVMLHPGYVQTDLNNGNGQITSEQSAAGLYKVISGLTKADDGKFYDYTGKNMPW